MFRSSEQHFSAFDVRPPATSSSCGGFQERGFGGGNQAKQKKEPLEKHDEKRLAESMNKLSIEERDKALHDLHGVADIPEESPDVLAAKLADMSIEIELTRVKNAYLLAESMRPSHVSNNKIRLKFLRAVDYDPKKAAERMVRYFEDKLDLFGQDKLVKDIELSDFTAHELEEVKGGIMISLDQRDRAGRAVLFAGPTDRCSLLSRQKLLFYLSFIASEDEMIQKRGMIVIKSMVGQRNFFPDRGMKASNLVNSLPVKVNAFHICYDDALMRAAVAAATFVLQQNHHARMRFHYGSLIETSYALMGYGIDCELPVGNDSRIRRELVERWINQRRQVEALVAPQQQIHYTAPRSVQSPPSLLLQQCSIGVVPTPNDVLLGRGKTVRDHPGSIKYRKRIESDREAYDNSSKFEKSVMIETILTGVKDSGGRFLQLGPNGYAEVDDDTARKRISHSWRNLRASKKSASPDPSSLKRIMDDFAPLSLNPEVLVCKRTKFEY